MKRSLLKLLLPPLLSVCGCAPAPRPPVIIVSIDTLRSDHLPVYGHQGLETPAIDQLRADGILFERAYSEIPLTLPSHVSLLSGRLPSAHGVRDNAGYEVSTTLAPWLPALAVAQGYVAGGFVSAYVLRRETGFGRGWTKFDDDVRPRPDLALGGIDRPGRETLAAALAWLRGVAERPFLLFVHFYEPHQPYSPPEPFRSRYAASPYDAEIAEADRLVGELVAELRRLGLYDRSLVVLLSDHGEGLGDHGEESHGVLLYRESLQVPLLLKLPGNARRGTTIATPAQLVDVLPTVASYIGAPPSPDEAGNSLLALPAERYLYAESYHGYLNDGWAPLHSLIAGAHHFIDSPAPELYDVVSDAAERRNLFAADRRTGMTLRQQMLKLTSPLVAPRAEDAETRAKLAALGYLAGSTGGAKTDPASLPAPQNQILALQRAGAASAAILAGNDEEAVRIMTGVLAENPRMVEGWSILGSALASLKRWPEALHAFEQCFESAGRDPNRASGVARSLIEVGRVADGLTLAHWALDAGMDDGVAIAQIGRRLMVLGRAAEAEALLRAGARGRTAPPVETALAELLASSGRSEEAVRVAQEAIALEPRDADPHEQLALAELGLRHWAEAETAARRAVELDSKRANAWNHLGVALYQRGDPNGALAAWQRATELSPQLFDALYNLGTTAAEAGHKELAARALRDFLARAPASRYGRDFPQVRSLLAQLESGRS